MVSYEKAIKSLWVGVCNIYVQQKTTNSDNKRTEFVETLAVANEPCRLSFATSSPAALANVGVADEAEQEVLLFVDKHIVIPLGSKIVVTQNGVTTEYAQSGLSAIYTYHQQVRLKNFEGWA